VPHKRRPRRRRPRGSRGRRRCRLGARASAAAERRRRAEGGGCGCRGARGAHSLGLSHTADRHFLGAAARRRCGTGGRAGGVPRCGRGGEDGGGRAAEARAAASAEAPGRIAWLAALRPMAMLSVPRRLLGLQTSLPGLWLRVSLWHMRVPGQYRCGALL